MNLPAGASLPKLSRCLRCALALLALAASLLGAPARADRHALHTDRLIVKLRDSVPTDRVNATSSRRIQAFAGSAGMAATALRATSDGGWVLRLPHAASLDEVQRLAEQLSNDPRVQYAEPDRIRRPMLVPDDPRYSEQWYWSDPTGGIDLPDAWDITTGDPGLVVAVLDSGVRPHAEFASRLLDGYDLISPDAPGDFFTANDNDGRDADATDPGDWVDAAQATTECPQQDSNWHGTYVTGLLAATGNNGLGIAGSAWEIHILPVRVLGRCGGFTSDIADGIRWAVGLPVPGVPPNSNPARVLNLSLGGEGTCTTTEQLAINDATARGALVVVAAGNEGGDTAAHSPSSCSGVIVVAATTASGSRASYTNVGEEVTLSAPGGSFLTPILSTVDLGTTVPVGDGYDFKVGTSASSTIVSGVIALMLSKHPTLTAAQVVRQLRATARTFPDTTCSTSTCGAGIVDAMRAVQSVQGAVAPVVNAGADQSVSAGAAVTLNGSESDDGTIVSRQWVQTAGTPVALTGADTLGPQFTAPSGSDTLAFQLSATDNDGLSDTASVTVTVQSGSSSGGGGALDPLGLLLAGVAAGKRGRRLVWSRSRCAVLS